MKITIIGGGGNTAEVTGAMLLMRGHEVNFYRFPNHVIVPGTPIRPKRSTSRLAQISITPSEQYKEYMYYGKARYIGADEIKYSDILIIAMPSYMMERLPILLPFAFSDKVVISLCERFHNTSVFLRSLKELGHPSPKIMISHRSDPFDANKTSKEGENRLWRVKANNDYYVTPPTKNVEALNIMEILYGEQALLWKVVDSIWDISFQNLNAISHAVTDLYALQTGSFIIGKSHYTKHTYTPFIVDRIKKLINERDLIANVAINRKYLSLEMHEAKSYGGKGYEDILGTNLFRYENPILRSRPAPEWYRASGFEDVGWSIVPLEELAHSLGIRVPHITQLINEWNFYVKVDYRKVGRQLGTIIFTLPIKRY